MMLASARLDESEVRFAVLGVCLAESVPRIALSEGRGPVGRVLAYQKRSSGSHVTFADPPTTSP